MELLSRDEINRIIQVVNLNTSLFKTCNVFGDSIHESHLLNSKTRYMEKSSASLTELVRTDIQTPVGTPTVFLKMWFSWNMIDPAEKSRKISEFYKKDSMFANYIFGDEVKFAGSVIDDTVTTSLNYEAYVYQYITENIILRNISPNFIPLLTNSTCSIIDIIHSMKNSGVFANKADLLLKLDAIYRMFPSLSMNFIMTGSAQSVTSAHDFFSSLLRKTIVIPQYEYSSIIFQFFYAMYVMNEFKIVHNDNHMGNVLIQTLPTTVTFDITIGKSNVQFTTRYVVKFFDWDRSHCQGVGQNPITNGFLYIRNVSEFTTGRDFSAFVCFLYGYNITGFNNILNRLIEGPKPSITSNNRNEIIRNGVTIELRSWMMHNPKSIVVDIYGRMYITIHKIVLEMLVQPSTIAILRNKLGKDQFGSYIYDGPNVTNIYLELSGNDLIIPSGYTCHPMYDSRDLDVSRYFTERSKFTELCTGLASLPGTPVYRYGTGADVHPSPVLPIVPSLPEPPRFVLPEPPRFVLPTPPKFVLPEPPKFVLPEPPKFVLPEPPKFYLSVPVVAGEGSFSMRFADQPDSVAKAGEMSTNDHFLNFARCVLVKKLSDMSSTKLGIERRHVILSNTLAYIFTVLHRYLTIDTIVEILKLTAYLLFKLGTLSYNDTILIFMKSILPFLDSIGDNVYELMAYVYNVEYVEDFYKVVGNILGEERVDTFRNYIKGKTVSFLNTPISLQRSIIKSQKLFGTEM
jgi:hypothetical protein